MSGIFTSRRNEIRALSNSHFNSFLAVFRLDYVVALPGERRAQDSADLRLVVDDENGCIVHRFLSLVRTPLRKSTKP